VASAGDKTEYETILVDREERVAIITLNRPKALNALNSQVMNELTSAATELDHDPGIGAIIITGSAKAFAAGADIKEMADLTFADAFGSDFFATWGKLAAVRTPTIAAVAGHALGGGCELAMMCDLLIAADTAKFGQPEIKLGVLRAWRLAAVDPGYWQGQGMDLILTGRTIDAAEAERSGLVSRVVPADDLLTEAKAVATTISQMSLSAARMAKEAVKPGFRIHSGRRASLRAAAVSFVVRDRGPVRGKWRVRRETPSQLHPPVGTFNERPRSATTAAATDQPARRIDGSRPGSQTDPSPARRSRWAEIIGGCAITRSPARRSA